MLPVAIIGSALYQLRLRIHLHIGNHIAGLEPFPLWIPQITIVRNIDSPRPTSPDAVFPTLDLTYCEPYYALPAVDEWDYGTRYGGALTERFVYWAKEASSPYTRS